MEAVGPSARGLLEQLEEQLVVRGKQSDYQRETQDLQEQLEEKPRISKCIVADKSYPRGEADSTPK